MAALPVVSVEIGFGQSIGTGRDAITWTDVTGFVCVADGGVTCTRGRENVGETPAPGSLRVTLTNQDGRFTPGTASGPHAGGVTARIPIRLRVGATPLWTGFVTDWGGRPGMHARVSVAASDILAQAGKIGARPWLTGMHLSQSPVAYWPLSDAAGAANAAAAAGAVPLTPAKQSTYAGLSPEWLEALVLSALSFGVTSDLGESSVAALTPYGTADQWIAVVQSASVAGFTPDQVVGVSMWLRPGSLPASGRHALLWSLAIPAIAAGGMVPQIEVALSSDGRMWLQDDASGAYVGLPGVVPAWRWTHVYLRRDGAVMSGSAWRVWFNGVEWPAPVIPAGHALAGAVVVSVAPVASTVFPSPQPFYGQLAHVAVWRGAGLGHLPLIVDGGGLPATAEARFERLAYATGRATALATWLDADATADAVVSAQDTGGRRLLDIAQDIAATERGVLIAEADGRMRMVSSRSRMVTGGPAVTLDARSDVLTLDDDAFAVDDADAVDEVTVTARPGGDEYRGARAGGDSLESIAFDVWTPDAVHAQAIADGVANQPVGYAKSPTLRVSMARAAASGIADAVLGLELGDVIRVTNLPTGAPASTIDLVVESIAHEITTAAWTVTLSTSSADAARGAYVSPACLVGSSATLRP